MNRNIIAALLLLQSGAAAVSATYCFSAGPENCSFEIERRRFCSWDKGRYFSLWTYSGGGSTYAAGLLERGEEGHLVSRRACSTGTATQCLQFRYYYEVDGIIDMSVSIRYVGSDTTEPPLWTTSASRYPWDYARVPIKTNRRFQVVITAKRRPGYNSSDYTVLVDNIQYGFREGCEVQPVSAKPPTPVTTTTTTQSTTTTTTTQSTTTTTTTTTTPAITTNRETEISTGSDERSKTRFVSADGGDVSVKPSNKVSIIIGTAAAVIVVLVVITVGIVVLLRRKRRTKAEPLQADASQGAPGSLVSGEPLYANCPGIPMTTDLPSARQNDHNHVTVSDTSDCYYSVVRSPGEASRHDDPATSVLYARVNKPSPEPSVLPNARTTRNTDPPIPRRHFSAPVYAKVNKAKKSRHTAVPSNSVNTNDSSYAVPEGEIDSSSTDKSRKWQHTKPPPVIGTKANESIYEIPDDDVDNSQNHRHAEPASNFSTGNDSIYSVPDDESGDSYHAHTKPSQVPGETTVAPPRGRVQEEQQYNVLDFDTIRRTPRQADRKDWERDASGEASDGVYNRLGAGDEGAYSEVGRDRRQVNVIDSEYSHIMK